jgi:hypothetical protein
VTFQERCEAVAAMGFSQRQAAFLTLAALHSGFCLRRQYAAFAGLAYGKNVRDFLDDLVTRNLARRVTFRRDRGHIYHLFSRSLYDALQQRDNRNRRHASPALIARKLMLLDYVLAHPDREWLVTEDEKVHFFSNTLRVPDYALPQRTYHPTRDTAGPTVRYCVQKLPLFITRNPLHVHFVCLVTDRSARDIALFVREHLSLTSHVGAHTLVVVRPAHICSDQACRAAHAAALGSTAIASPPLDPATIGWYFEARRRVECGDLRTMSVEDIQRYRACRRRAADTLELAYRQWTDRGCLPVDRPADLLGGSQPAGPSKLVVITLPHRYEQFGALPGIA